MGRPAARAGGQPRLQLLPGPVIHADFPPPAALAAPDHYRTPTRVEVGLAECERLGDPQPGAPEHDDQAAQALSVGGVAGGAQYRDDLLDCRRVRGVSHRLVPRRAARVEARERGG